MQKCRIVTCCVILACLAGSYRPAAAQVTDQEKSKIKSDEFMRAKLSNAKLIVEGLATNDHQKIEKAAQALTLLSYESEWEVIQTEDYGDLSQAFRSSTDRLQKAALDKNLDGATLAYFEVTLNCVQCHKYLRRKMEPKKSTLLNPHKDDKQDPQENNQ